MCCLSFLGVGVITVRWCVVRGIILITVRVFSLLGAVGLLSDMFLYECFC